MCDLRLFVLLCCVACIASASDKVPTKVKYLSAQSDISTDEERRYFSTGPKVSLQNINGIPHLNWQCTIDQDIGFDLKVDLNVKTKNGDTITEVIRTGPVFFCNSTSALIESYAKLCGMHASTPPMLCPIAKGHYFIDNFVPDEETLSQHIISGEQFIEFMYYIDNKVVAVDTLHVDVS